MASGWKTGQNVDAGYSLLNSIDSTSKSKESSSVPVWLYKTRVDFKVTKCP